MNAISQSDFLLALGWAVLNSLWQMALLWVLYQLITGINKKFTPASKTNLATVFLFAGFAWFCYSLISFLTGVDSSGANAYRGITTFGGNEQVNEWLRTSLPLASAAYLLLLIFPIANFLRNYQFVQSIRRYGLSRADVQSRLFVQKMAARMGIKKDVYLWISEMVTSPVTIGYLRPVILLPLAAVNNLSTQQLEAVLLHELSHIRRYDYFLNLIIKFIQSVLYFNPFVKAFIKGIECEREKSCDEIVMQFQYEPHGYASALLELERSNHLRKTLTVAASGKKNDLLHRVEWIMGIRKKNQFTFSRVAGVLAAVFCFIALNALILISARKDVAGKSPSYSNISAPLYFFDEGKTHPGMLAANTEMKNQSVINIPHSYPLNKSVTAPNSAATEKIKDPAFSSPQPAAPPTMPATPFSFASFVGNISPMLEAQKDAQIAIALEASKKVIADGQWKEMEKSIADAMTSVDKEVLKKAYTTALRNIDLTNVEKNLHLAYDQIDWQNINVQLNNALAEIKIDSVQKVYNIALANLCDLQKEMSAEKVVAIPDSDITIRTVAEKQKEVSEVLNKLKVLRTRKIVRL